MLLQNQYTTGNPQGGHLQIVIGGLVDDPDVVQVGDTCWAYSLTRQMNAVCRLSYLIGRSETFSVTDFILFMNRTGSLTDELTLRGFGRASVYLRQYGMVRLEDFERYYNTQDGILIDPTREVRIPRFVISVYTVRYCEDYPSYDDFESAFFTAFNHSPVAASVPSYPSLDIFRSEGNLADRIYCPTMEERLGPDPVGHTMFATGRGRFNGIRYVQFRDSAIGGILNVRLGVRVIVAFVEMGEPRMVFR